jgi:hypothetical protein
VRRLRRILLNAATVLSLLLCVATAGLWARSYLVRDVIVLNARGTFPDTPAGARDEPVRYSAELDSGTVILTRLRGSYVTPDWRDRAGGPPARWRWYADAPWNLRGRGILGFWTDHGGPAKPTVPTTRDVIAIPVWPVALVLALFPVLRLRAAIRRRRPFGSLLCPACGYDLRATPDRCPECGHKPSS